MCLSLTAAAAIALSGTPAVFAATPDAAPGALELANAQLSRTAATQGMVLLENSDRALPLAKGGNVALFGVGAHYTVKGGTGAGNVNNRSTVNVRQGLESAGYRVTTSPAYWDAMVSAFDAKYAKAVTSALGAQVDFNSVEQPLTAASAAATAPTDTAVYVLSRTAGEGADRSAGPGDYQLGATEAADLAVLGATFKRVVVVLNVGGVVDTSFFPAINGAGTDPAGGPALDAMLLMSQAGQDSGNALADVLTGTVNPSGKLTDTWTSKYAYNPAAATFSGNDKNTATEQYREGVYVGYRYFDSFYKSIDPANPAGVVTYPFGYGQSYTTFETTPVSITATPQRITVRARVTNTGTSTGREVVQVYASAPQTGLDKPYQQLAGYGKTADLAPKASQEVTISFRTTDLASYDEAKAAWVMDAGDYLIRLGNSSRSTHVAAVVNLTKTAVTEQNAHEMNGQRPDTELDSDPADFYSYPAEQREIATAWRRTVAGPGIQTVRNTSEFQQNVPVDASSPYTALDGDLISSTTAYVPQGQRDWESTAAPYVGKTGETVKQVSTRPGTTLYDVSRGWVSMEQFIAQLDVMQLSNLVEGASTVGSTPVAAGAAGYTTPTLEKLGIPGVALADGPAGLRLPPKLSTTPATYQWATAFPNETSLAQTWDRQLITQVGVGIGKEMAAYGVTLWLAPGMDIHRDPLGGRNFEYYSEDPLVTGLSGAAATAGVQSLPGLGVTIKHFAANNQEANRTGVNELISERALREIYLRGFQIAVQTAQPMAVMSGFHKVNGTYTPADHDLLTDLLRGEWDFQGLVMSDWNATAPTGPVAPLYAGNDLIMPGLNPTEVAAQIRDVAPDLDLNGLPATVTKTYASYSFLNSATPQLGGLTLDPAGAQVFTTRVDASTDLTGTPKSQLIAYDSSLNVTTSQVAPYGTVQGAYAALTTSLAGKAFAKAPAGAITVTDVQHQVPGDATSPVTAYTVTVKGNYAPVKPLRLGDLQRSAMQVLDVVMQSTPFQQLAQQQGVRGITVAPYSRQFLHLTDWVTTSTGPVVRR
jgi:beta-glucosidase